jgi:predicted ATPase
MRVLESIQIQNFKSIREQELALGQLNVFIGGNGSGKSNLIQVFRFLREIEQRNLASYSLERGADSLLFFGRKVSPFVEFYLQFGESDISNAYRIRLTPTDEGALVVNHEVGYFHDRRKYPKPYDVVIGGASKESGIRTSTERVAKYVRRDLENYRVYHFHDTSDGALVKAVGPLDDNRVLRQDASNLAAFLYLLQQTRPDHFRNIEDALRQIAPFFERFNLEPSRLAPDKIRLEWKEKGSDAYFNAASLSDGTLRFMCLAALLLQPDLPPLILLDEPELGLHPAAVALLADLLSSAATRTQVIVATQSVTLVNQFEPEQVWTVDRDNGQSVFRHLAKQDLSAWLDVYGGCEGYGLGELWEKNILGARP